MKLKINFDLIRRIEEANGQFKLHHIIKDNAVDGIKWFSIYTTFNLLTGKPIDSAIADAAGLGLIIYSLMVGVKKIVTTSPFAQASALMDLIILSLKLEKIRVNTDFELLMDSVEYHREHKLVLNEKKLPQILQSKYIMVPTYDNGEIREESILQEHFIGSKDYYISKGSPAKQYKLAFSRA